MVPASSSNNLFRAAAIRLFAWIMSRASHIACLVAAVCACAFAVARDARVYFPAGYRAWTITKFKVIGPESDQFESQGGMRHHYANDKALASWGKFRDGAVLVDERVHATLDDRKIWQEGGLVHVAVMRKDARGHADTGGWYFNVFSRHDTAIGITAAQAKARCFDACHKAQEARDYVFSDPRR
jgi:hypothetical protein